MSRYGRDIYVTCKVILDPEKSFYNPGDDVQGFIFLTNMKPTSVLYYGCKAVLEGTILVRFKEVDFPHYKTETFLQKFEMVHGNSKTKLLLTPPKTTLPFCIKLPSTTLPGSCSSEYGVIMYQVVAYVRNAYRWIKRGETKFSVNAILEFPPSPDPLIYEKSTTVTMHKKPFIFKLTLTCGHGSIYYAGKDDIRFNLNLENPAGLVIKNMELALLQKITFHAGPSKIVKDVVATAKSTEMSQEWTSSLKIPSKTRPSQYGLIQIEYFLKFIVSPEDQPPSSSLKGEIPITICSKGVQIQEVTHLGDHSPHVRSRIAQGSLSPSSPRPSLRARGFDGGRVSPNLPFDPPAPPPDYNTLKRSYSSETLPPDYEDALGSELWNLQISEDHNSD